jgi:hypothetical protein
LSKSRASNSPEAQAKVGAARPSAVLSRFWEHVALRSFDHRSVGRFGC